MISNEEWANDLRQADFRCNKYKEEINNLEQKINNYKEDLNSMENLIKLRDDEIKRINHNYSSLDGLKFKYQIEILMNQLEK